MPAENYMVPLKRAYDKPRTRRSNVAVKEIFDFLYKHTRKKKEDIVLSKEVNEFVWKRGIQKPPRKIPISIKIKDDKVYVFLKDSKEIDNFFNKEKVSKEKKSVKEQVLEMKENMQNPKTAKKDTKKTDVKETSKKEETSKDTEKIKPKLDKIKTSESSKENTSKKEEDTSKKEEKSVEKK